MSQTIASTYEIIRKLGAGGGGTVFLAEHLRLGKKVVLKADKREITTSQELLRREVDILKELNHNYIPRVYDFFVEGETVYTVMDYIEGESLDKPLERGEVFSQPQVIQWGKQILEALRYLHEPVHGNPPRGFVHSDIKPANLMRKPDNHICLIDFNIALALGEKNVVGRSAGYASPEHYGLDFSFGADAVNPLVKTEILPKAEQEDTGKLSDLKQIASVNRSTGVVNARKSDSGSSEMRMIVPDVRSDIYSTGATLYHLLSGERPAKNAKEVVPLSKEKFSPLLVAIITKAMNPNPDLRYQTAEEMLSALRDIYKNDPRVKRQKREQMIAGVLFSALFAVASICAFVGLKRMQTTEQWLKLAEYSRNAFTQGERENAIRYALQALPEEKKFLDPEYVPEAECVLAKVLGVYDLSDDYQYYHTINLPSAPLYLTISPDGKTAACIYAYSVVVFDTETAEILAELPAEESALAEVEYLDDHRILYAGKNGLTAYDIENRTELWKGKPATAISISADGKRAAAIYKKETFAFVYDTENGHILDTVNFDGKYQRVTVNDSFANPKDNLLALNPDGTMLAVSFEDGSLVVYELAQPENALILFDETSGYTHFEGGFYQKYLAFSAANADGSLFAVVDTEEQIQTGGFDSQSAFGVQTDESGIYVQTENLLVKIHPVTGEQIPLVSTSENILGFARSEKEMQTIVTTKEEVMVFDEHAKLISRRAKEYDSNFVQIKGGIALEGSSDSPVIRMMRYENHSEAEVFSYDPSILHDEARISADGETVMLFSYDRFYLFDRSGNLIQETAIPEAEQVYDQQYIRENGESRLEVTYNDGIRIGYSAVDGSILYEIKGEKPDLSLYEEFVLKEVFIISPLHGTPQAYDKNTGKELFYLEDDAYLTYATQAGEHIVAQYVTADGRFYGQLLNRKGKVLAELPYLCDVFENRVLFDYPTGNMRETRIYNTDELIELAQREEGGKE